MLPQHLREIDNDLTLDLSSEDTNETVLVEGQPQRHLQQTTT